MFGSAQSDLSLLLFSEQGNSKILAVEITSVLNQVEVYRPLPDIDREMVERSVSKGEGMTQRAPPAVRAVFIDGYQSQFQRTVKPWSVGLRPR